MDLLADRTAIRRPTAAANPTVIRAGGTTTRSRPDRVVTEEPMAIRIAGPRQEPSDVSVTMRTPGNDFELAVGFCWNEGLITSPSQVKSVRYCGLEVDTEQRYNVVTIRLNTPVDVRQRAFTTTSSCGVCGTESLDMLQRTVTPISLDGAQCKADVVLGLPEQLRSAQKIFDSTGGLHGAGLFTANGDLIVVREDVGRHNAVDKIVGKLVLDKSVDTTASTVGQSVLVVSGRTSYEIVQKTAMAGISMLVAVSAPSSLAIDAANRVGITLVGFVRNGTANVYTHPHRIG
jgi:FdhD protein